MAKMVGLSRNLKLPWLNEVVRLYAEGLDDNQIKEKLNEYLSFEIGSPTVLRKTREILMNIWVYENDYTAALRDEALRLFQKDSDYALPVHWCMMLAAYPVFLDMCRLIGKIGEFEEIITTKQIKQKLFDEWGERSTLYHSSDKLIATLKELHASGLTVIMVTQYMEEVTECDRVIVMNHGKIAKEGTPEDVFRDKALLQSCSLAEPEAIRLADRLREFGVPISERAMRSETIAEELCRLL